MVGSRLRFEPFMCSPSGGLKNISGEREDETDGSEGGEHCTKWFIQHTLRDNMNE